MAPGDRGPVVWLVAMNGPAAAHGLAAARATPEDLADAAVWRSPERAAGRLLRRRLLRALAARALDVHPDRIDLARSPDGRPSVGAPEPLCASVARREGWAALALSPRPIGVDLEAARPPEPLPIDLLPPAAQADIAELPSALRAEAFARLWSAQEAHAKATGRGLTHALAQTAPPAAFRDLGDLIAAAVQLG